MKLLSHDYGTPTLPIEHARPILESENHESICVTSGTIFIIPRRHSWMMRGIFVPLLSRVTFRKEKVALQVGCAASRVGLQERPVPGIDPTWNKVSPVGLKLRLRDIIS